MDTNTTLFRVDVSQTTKDRQYWATRPWASDETAHHIRTADLLLLPWEDFREKRPTLFPQGTTDFMRMLIKRLPESAVAVAVDKEWYQEIALHARKTRWPTIMVTAVMLPLLVDVLSDCTKKLIDEHASDQTIEFRVIVEGQHRQCIEVEYKGAANDLARTLAEQADRCLAELERKPSHSPEESRQKR